MNTTYHKSFSFSYNSKYYSAVLNHNELIITQTDTKTKTKREARLKDGVETKLHKNMFPVESVYIFLKRFSDGNLEQGVNISFVEDFTGDVFIKIYSPSPMGPRFSFFATICLKTVETHKLMVGGDNTRDVVADLKCKISSLENELKALKFGKMESSKSNNLFSQVNGIKCEPSARTYVTNNDEQKKQENINPNMFDLLAGLSNVRYINFESESEDDLPSPQQEYCEEKNTFSRSGLEYSKFLLGNIFKIQDQLEQKSSHNEDLAFPGKNVGKRPQSFKHEHPLSMAQSDCFESATGNGHIKIKFPETFTYEPVMACPSSKTHVGQFPYTSQLKNMTNTESNCANKNNLQTENTKYFDVLDELLFKILSSDYNYACDLETVD